MASISSEGGTPAGAAVPRCDLCEAARFTHWYYEDEVCWVADCEVCDCPMVVWRHHGTEPADGALDHMLERLRLAGVDRFGDGSFVIDRVMRQIPDHFHSHARDSNWHARRWTSKPSRYNGVGGERRTT